MELVVKENLVLEERRISLSEFHTADEVFMLILESPAKRIYYLVACQNMLERKNDWQV